MLDEHTEIASDLVDRSPRRRRFALWIVATAGVLVSAVAETAILDHASNHAFRGNSDGATVVLEGQWISAGHLALAGWGISLDSFWTLDALFYALAVRLFGVHGELLNIVPSVIAVVVIAVGCAIALLDRRRNAGRAAAVAVVLAFLAFPSNNLAYVFLQGPWHVGTVLACLVAFWALARPTAVWRIALAACCLAAGLLGDTQTVALGCAPVLGAAGLAAIRRRSSVSAVPGFVAATGGFALAFVARSAARLAGTYSIATGYPSAHARQIPVNLAHLGSWGISLLGHGALPNIGMDNGAGHIDLIRVATIVIFVAGLAAGLAATLVGVIRGRDASPAGAAGWRIDDLLLCGVIGDCILFVAVTPNDNGNYARYLTAAVIFGALLAAWMAGRYVDRMAARPGQIVAGAFIVVAVVSAIALLRDLAVPAAQQPDLVLANFLESHDLRYGIGDYWSASITTVESANRVEVRPVIANHQKKLVRYGRQSAASWYEDVAFNFLVYDTDRPWRDVNARTAAASFGEPSKTLSVGPYRILVWNRATHVSATGFSNK